MYSTLKIFCTSLLLLLLLSACQQPLTESSTSNTATTSEAANEDIKTNVAEMSIEERKMVAKMEWVLVADPLNEAQRSLAVNKTGGKPELIAFSNRALIFPGLTDEQYTTIEKQTRYRIPEGTGDVLYGEEHGRLHAAMYDYAEKYNREIFNALAEK